jgi:hypothetical protein
MSLGVLQRFYIIELHLSPWEPTHPGNAHLVVESAPRICPVFQNEEAKSFLRSNGVTTQIRHVIKKN